MKILSLLLGSILGATALVTASPALAEPKVKADPALAATCKSTTASDERNVNVSYQGIGSTADQIAKIGPVGLIISVDWKPSTWRIDNRTHVVCKVIIAEKYKFTLGPQTIAFSVPGTWNNNGGDAPGAKKEIEDQLKVCITRVADNQLTFEFYGIGPAYGNVTPYMTVFFHPTLGGDGGGQPTTQSEAPSVCPAGKPGPNKVEPRPDDRPPGGGSGPDRTGGHE